MPNSLPSVVARGRHVESPPVKSICLITPGHLSTNPRIVKEADALHAAGYRVSVIAADFSRWARQADREFDDRGWQLVARVPFGPDAPLLTRVVQVARQRLARLLFRGGSRASWVGRTAWHPITPELIRLACGVRADLYVAHYPAALPAAALAAARHGARYAFDAEDFHLGDLPDGPGHESTRALLRCIEACYLPGCAYVTAASPGIADSYASAYGIPRPRVILNVFPVAQGPRECTDRGSWSPGPSLYWFSQTVGTDRGLECAVRAIGISQAKPHLVLRGLPAAGFVDALSGLARECGVADRIHFLPPAAPAEMERLASQHDLGLVGETGHTLNHRMALANKLFSFLLAGVPVLLSDIPAHRQIAGELGAAARLYAVETPASLAAVIDSMLSADKAVLSDARRHAFNVARQRFNWDREQAGLLDVVAQAVA